MMMDHVQLTHPASSTPQQNKKQGDDDARLVEMCPSLYRAVHNGRMEEVLAMLLRQHAPRSQATAGIIRHGRCDILEASAEGNTVLHVAAEHGHGELIRELFLRFREKKGLLLRRNKALDTLLHCAARAGRVKAVSVLVQLAGEFREDILGCKNEAGDTALHLAARHGHGAAVEVLVSAAETAASELNNAGVSPLYLAVTSGSVQAVRAITSSCRDAAAAAGPTAQNALHAAVFQSEEIVELLLEWRPSLADEVDCNGSTPLHFASSDGHRSVVRTILRAAPPRTVYRKDHTGGLSALHVAARMGHRDIVEELLKSCPDAGELRDDGGGTFLHAAAKEKRYSIVSLAVKNPMLRGLLDARDREGNTPLHLAVAAGAPLVVETLLLKGKVQANVLNDDGHTPLDLAEKSTSFFTMVSLVLILIACRAQSRPQRQDHLKPWSGRDMGQGIEKASDSLSVVAGLIVAITFAAGFQLPGGYGDDGTANLKDKRAFTFFMFFNSFAAEASVVTVILLVYGKASRSAGSWKSFVAALHSFWMSLNFLILAFYAALTAVSNKGHRSCLLAVYVTIRVLIFVIMVWIAPPTRWELRRWRNLWRSRFNTRQHAILKRQYPFAAVLISNLILFEALHFAVSFCFGIVFSPSLYSYLNGRHNA